MFCIASGFMPFVMAPNQFGMPATQTQFYGIVLGANLLGNLLLIPLWGIEGAAVATGLSFIINGCLVLRFLYYKHILNT